jgi:hypothetical protein
MQPSAIEECRAIFPHSNAVADHQFKYLKGWIGQNGKIYTENTHISAPRIDDILNARELPKEAASKGSFRVLSVTRPILPKQQAGIGLHVGTSKCILQIIVERWQLHVCTLEAIVHNDGVFTEFKSGTKRHLFVRVPNSVSIGYDFVFISHDCVSRTTDVFYHGLGDEASVFSTILRSPRRCLNPMFFIAVLYRFHQLQVERHRNIIDMTVLGCEKATGFGHPGRITEPDDVLREEFSQVVNYKSIVRRLSFCHSDLAIIGHVVRFSVDLGNWLAEITEQRNLCPGPDEKNSSRYCGYCKDCYAATLRCACRDSATEILQEVKYTLRRSITALSQIRQMSGRTQSQTTAVSTTLISILVALIDSIDV